MIGGFWIIQASSEADAIALARRIPASEGTTLEVRRVAELSEFEGSMSRVSLAQEEAIRDKLAGQAR
jgi:hypothetical protein